MKVVSWALFTLHVINCIFSLMALCGLEKHICIGYVMLAMFVYDAVILIWSQFVYFKAQSFNCNIQSGRVYFWLMGEILFFYIFTAAVICYFFRKFCEDPQARKEREDEEAAELQAEIDEENEQQ